jgi:hypothetical protein
LKIYRILGVLLVLTATASCNFTEEIYLNEDGSGNVSLSFDASELMAFSQEALDSIPEAATDTIVYFSDVLDEKKDSIATLPAEDQARLEKLRPYRMQMKSDPAENSMFFTLGRDFDDISDVEDSFNAFQDAGALDPDSKSAPVSETNELDQTTEVDYTFGAGRFSRRSFITDSVLHQQRLDSLEGGAAFLSGSTYTLKIHFPRRVKTADASDATLSVDGKTLIRQVDLLDYLKDPHLLDIQVELED